MNGVVHGGAQDDELARYGLIAADIIDLSANLHPDGPDPMVVEAARGAVLDRYPQATALPLRDAIALAHGLVPASVLVVPGGTVGIHIVARTLLRPGDQATVTAPSFGEYAAATAVTGAAISGVTAFPPDFELNVDTLPRATVTFLCIPDNPTGRDLTREDVLRAVEVTGGTVVVDAAYEPFVDRAPFASDLAQSTSGVVAIHSMTKLHAVPGLRLGYVVATPERIAQLGALLPSWSIDAPSIAAGIVAAGQHELRRGALQEMRETRERLRARWLASGLEVAPGTANFLLVKVGHARAVREALLAKRIVVRDASSFGLPEWIRVAVPASQHADAVGLAVIAAVMGDGAA